MKVSELIYLLQAAQPDADVQIIQPRTWTKKQPDRTMTSILMVSVWHDGRIVRLETMQ